VCEEINTFIQQGHIKLTVKHL